MRAATALTLPLLALSAPALAATSDEQAWVALSASTPLSHSVTLSADVSQRFREAGVGGNQVQARAFLDDALSKHVSISAGLTYAGSATSKEVRPSQQITFGFGAISLRTTLEERFMSGPSQMGLRLREKVQAKFPLGPNDRLSVSAEPFFVLQPTVAGKPTGFEQVRLGLSDEHKLSKYFSVSLGYIFIEKAGKSKPDQHTNVAQLTIAWKG